MNDIKPTQPVPVPPYYFEAAREDEISLVDLWLVLAKRKHIILATTLLCLGLAVVFTFLKSEKEVYTTSIRIGSVISDNGATPVESPDTTLAKLNETYIPLAQSAMEQPVDVNTRQPNGSELIVLESTVPPKFSEQAISLHKQVVSKIEADHNNLVRAERSRLQERIARLNLTLSDLKSPQYLQNLKKDLLRQIENKQQAIENANNPDFAELPIKEMQQQINSAGFELESLKNQAALIRSKQKQIDTRSELVEAEIKDLKAMIAAANKRLVSATGEATNESKAMTLLLLENTIQENRAHLAKLENQLYVDLPREAIELEQALEENSRRQSTQKEKIELLRTKLNKLSTEQEIAKKRLTSDLRSLELELARLETKHELRIKEAQADIDSLENRLNMIQKTENLSEPLKTATQSKSTALIIALGLILGVMAGVFLAFFISFLDKVKSVREEEQAT